MYFGLLLDKSKVGVAESEKRVAAIFLLLVWPLEPPGRSFLPYSGVHVLMLSILFYLFIFSGIFKDKFVANLLLSLSAKENTKIG